MIMCPSNSSMKMFPENTAAEFTNQLPSALELGNDWELGLSEILFTHSWKNIREGSNHFDMRVRTDDREDGARGEQLVDRNFINPGKYRSVPDVFEAMKKALMEKHGKVNLYNMEMKYDPVRRRTVFNTKGEKLDEHGNPFPLRRSMRLGPDVAAIFGFEAGAIIKSDKITVSPYPAMTSGGFYNMYVYCDAIQPQIVGDVKVPCLRILPIDARPDEIVIAKRFNHVYYMPLASHRIPTISFKITDDTGRNVAFDYGKTIITLHCRRRSSVRS